MIKKAAESVRERIVRPWIIRHYKNTRSGRAIEKLRDTHKGERCFFIGNGPSLRATDLDTLCKVGEVTFAFNRIFNIFDQTEWRPTYYISQDEKMLMGSVEEIDRQQLGVRFIPINCKWYHGIEVRNAAWFMMRAPREENGKPLDFSANPASVVYQGGTGMYTAAQFAVFMGFREIFMIGVDHHFHTSVNARGEIVVDPTAKDYFSEDYNRHKDQLYIPNTEKSTLTYVAMKEQCEKRGVRVYNATRGGRLEVFDRVDFDSLFD